MKKPIIVTMITVIATLLIMILLTTFVLFGFGFNRTEEYAIPTAVVEQIPNIPKSKIMDKETFWRIIEIRPCNRTHTESATTIIDTELGVYNQLNIVRFGYIADIYLELLEKNKAMQAANYLISGTKNNSQENTKLLSQWVILEGSDIYKTIALHPDSLATLDITVGVTPSSIYDENNFDRLQRRAKEIYEKKIGEGYDDAYQYIQKTEGESIRKEIMDGLELYNDSKFTNSQISKELPMLSLKYQRNTNQ